MKRLRMLWEFYHGNAVAALLLFLIMTASLVYASYAVGTYRFLTYTRDLYIDSSLPQALYFMPDIEHEMKKDPFHMNGRILSLQKDAAALSGVNDILSMANGPLMYNGGMSNYTVLRGELAYAYQPRMEKGTWFRKEEVGRYGDAIPAVVGGKLYEGLRPGDEVEITLGYEETSPIRIHVIGTLGEYSYVPYFHEFGTGVGTDGFLFRSNDIILCEDDRIRAMLEKQGDSYFQQANCFVTLEPGLDEAQKAELRRSLEKHGYVLDSEAILENTQEQIDRKVKRTLPFPLFALAVSTIAFFSVSILFAYKKFADLQVYSLCGCGRLRGFSYIASGIGLLGVLSGLVTFTVIRLYQTYDRYFPTQFQVDPLLIDGTTYGLVLLYLFIVLLLSICVPFVTYFHLSPLETYRRREA